MKKLAKTLSVLILIGLFVFSCKNNSEQNVLLGKWNTEVHSVDSNSFLENAQLGDILVSSIYKEQFSITKIEFTEENVVFNYSGGDIFTTQIEKYNFSEDNSFVEIITKDGVAKATILSSSETELSLGGKTYSLKASR